MDVRRVPAHRSISVRHRAAKLGARLVEHDRANWQLPAHRRLGVVEQLAQSDVRSAVHRSRSTTCSHGLDSGTDPWAAPNGPRAYSSDGGWGLWATSFQMVGRRVSSLACLGARRLKIPWRRGTGDPQAFDELVEVYEKRDQLTRGWVTDWLEETLEGYSGRSAIDLGCGNGRAATILAGHFLSVRAVDLSAQMVALASARRPHPRITYEQGDIDKVTGRYDLVLCMMVLHHVPDIFRSLTHIAELVAPGGTAILVDPAEPPRARWQFHLGHFLALAHELRARQPHAWARFRVKSDRRWMDHLASDRFLTVEQFREIYSSALPGAIIGPVQGLHSAIWSRPPQGPGSNDEVPGRERASGRSA